MAIIAQSVSKRFQPGEPDVLRSIDLVIQEGEMVALTGRSGSGKSTLLYLLSTLDNPSSGTISIDGRDVASMDVREVHELRNRAIGFIFQFHYLLPELSVLENVLMPARKTHSVETRRKRALDLLEAFGIAQLRDRLPSQLSGGEQQRVAIARAIVMEPRYLFADEPTGNLDSANGSVVMGLIRRLNRESGMTVLLVTHESDYAAMAGRVLRMVDGQLTSSFNSPKES